MSLKTPEICFTQSSGHSLAYQCFGDGPPLLFINGFVSHLECLWEEPDLAQFFRQLSAHFQLILFDKRGVGLSERLNAVPSVEETSQDVLAILAALNIESAHVMGVSEGGPAALLFAATHPRKVNKLVLYGTMPKWIRSYDYPWALSSSQYDQWLESMVNGWGQPVSLEIFAPSKIENSIFCDWWAKSLRQSASPASLRAILKALHQIDVRECLSYVQTPVLILHKTLDKAVPVQGARFLCKHLKQFKLIELSGTDHWWWTEDHSTLVTEIEEFLGTQAHPDFESSREQLSNHEQLSARELEILKLMATGLSNQAIADSLFLSLGTIKTYSSSIYSKLNVKSRSEAIASARKLGLLG